MRKLRTKSAAETDEDERDRNLTRHERPAQPGPMAIDGEPTPEVSRVAAIGSTSDTRRAGTSPNSTVVAAAAAATNAISRQSAATVRLMGFSAVSRKLTSVLADAIAIGTAAAARQRR